MVLPVTVQLVNHRTGEVYATTVIDNFQTASPEYKNKLYRWCDCLLRAVEKGEDLPLLQIYANKYPQDPSFF